MDAYLQPIFSCHLYMEIIRQKKKDFREIEKNEDKMLKEFLH